MVEARSTETQVGRRRPRNGDASASAKDAKSPRLIQSVDRALVLLEALSQARNGISLQDLSASTGLNVSTCHHLLTTLAQRGYVGQDPRTREYSLGNKVIELSEARVRQIDIVRLATPALTRLNEETGETVHLAAMQGRDLVTLAKLDSYHAVKVDSGGMGKSGAAHATATGKAILAWLPESEIRAVLASSGMIAYTDNTIQTAEALIEQLALVRRHGYAEDREEFQPGVLCIGTAIRDHAGAVVASLSVSVPMMRATDAAAAKIREMVKATAVEVSRQLGSRSHN